MFTFTSEELGNESNEFKTSDEGVKLHDINSGSEYAGPTLELGWCISKALLEELEQKKITDPQLLLVVTHGDKEVNRHLVDLFDLRAQLAFYHHGVNRVHALVVWGENPKAVRKKLTGKRNGICKIKVLDRVCLEDRRLNKEINRLEKKRDDLTRKARSLDEPNDTDPSSNLDGDEEEIQRLYREISVLEVEITKLDGSYVEPDPELTKTLRAEASAIDKEIAALYGQLSYSQDVEAEYTLVPIEKLCSFNADRLSLGFNEEVFRCNNWGYHDFDLPEEVFGQNWAITTWLANLSDSWPGEAKVQCDVRKRASAMLVLGLPVVLLAVIATVFGWLWLVVLLLAGARGINYSALKRASKSTPNDYLNDGSYSRWVHRMRSNGDKVRCSLWLTFFNPLTIAVAGLIAFATHWATGSMRLFVYIACVVAVLVGLFFMATWLVKDIPQRLKDRSIRQHDKRVRRMSENARAIACDSGQIRPDVALPHRRKVTHVLAGAKNKVCKPLALND